MDINDKNAGKRVGIILIIVIVLWVLVFMHQFVSCIGSGINNHYTGPRHTQNVNFKKNNVNSIIFTTPDAAYIINKV